MSRSLIMKCLFVAGLCGLGPVLVWADDGVGQRTSDAEAAVVQLLEQLNSSSRRIRHEAETSLIERGESIIPVLTRSSADQPASVQSAVQRIIAAIETSAAERLLQASRVTLTDASLTVEEVFGQIERQTSNSIDLSDSLPAVRRKRVDVDLQQIPFWSAVDEICTKSQLGWGWEKEATLSVSSNWPVPSQQAIVVDCFRISVINRPRRQNFNTPHVRRILRLECHIAVEPRIHPFYLAVHDSDFLIEQDGKFLRPFNPAAKREFGFLEGQSVSVPLDFMRDPDLKLVAGTVRGKVSVRCAAKRIPFTIALHEEKDPPHQAGDMELRLVSSRVKEAGVREVTLQVRFSRAGPELESHRLGALHRDAWLTSPDGRQVSFRDRHLVTIDGLVHTVRYVFPGDEIAGEWTLTYLAPALITTAELPFVITSVPLDHRR